MSRKKKEKIEQETIVASTEVSQQVEQPKVKDYSKCAIIIPHLNEPAENIDFTKKSLDETIPEAKQYWEEDKNQEGTSITRHKAIMRAIEDGCEYFVTIDAHMKFKENTLKTVFDYLMEHPNEITNINCYHNPTCSFEGGKYLGARFTLYAKNKTEHVALCGQWRKKDEPINCVMGACYGFSKYLYNKMCQPWRLSKGWGLDEEVLSMCCYFVGGKISHLDVDCAHLFRTKGRNTNPNQNINLWTNRYMLLEILPVDDLTRLQLLKWMFRTPSLTSRINSIKRNMADKLDIIREIKENFLIYNIDPKPFLDSCRHSTEEGISILTPKGHEQTDVKKNIEIANKMAEQLVKPTIPTIPNHNSNIGMENYNCDGCKRLLPYLIRNNVKSKYRCPHCGNTNIKTK